MFCIAVMSEAANHTLKYS